MNRQEFIDQLRIALAGNVMQSVIDENVNYYYDYIDMKIKKGQPEEEVLDELGSPRLLAKTIIETSKAEEEKTTGSNRNSSAEKQEENDYSGQRNMGDKLFKILNLPKWALIIVAVLVIFIVFAVLASLVSLAAYLFIPILVICIIIWVVRYIIQAFKS